MPDYIFHGNPLPVTINRPDAVKLAEELRELLRRHGYAVPDGEVWSLSVEILCPPDTSFTLGSSISIDHLFKRGPGCTVSS